MPWIETLIGLVGGIGGTMLGIWYSGRQADRQWREDKRFSLYADILSALPDLARFETDYFKILDKWEALGERVTDAKKEELEDIRQAVDALYESTNASPLGPLLLRSIALEDDKQLMLFLRAVLDLLQKYGQGVQLIHLAATEKCDIREFKLCKPDLPILENAPGRLLHLLSNRNLKGVRLSKREIRDEVDRLAAGTDVL